MKLFLGMTVAIALASTGLGAPVTSKYFARLAGPKNEIMPGLVMVKYSPSQAAKFVNSKDKIQLLRSVDGAQNQIRFQSRIGQSGWTLWQIPAIMDPVAYANSFKSQKGVLNAQPVNRIYPLLDTPNDPDFNAEETSEDFILFFGEDNPPSFRRLWNLDEINAVGGWTSWPNKWYTSANKPKDAPHIAVIDTGVDGEHPDFANAGGTSTDSANGGQIDYAKCQQFQLGEIVTGGSAFDLNGHGTHVFGLALASGNNGGYAGHGIIGTGYACKGSILRVFDDSGNGTDADASAAIFYAADTGAEVINISLGTTNFSQIFQDAVTYAWQKGCLVVCAGNESGSGGGNIGPIYPAACSGALAVSANGAYQTPATRNYSGTGRYVDIAAPGGDLIQGSDYYMIQYVYSTASRYDCSLSQNPILIPPYTLDYTYLIGTSMACPQVSGAAGNYYGKYNLRQGNWNNVRAYRALENSADGVMGAPNGGWELSQGYGSLNMGSLMSNTNTRSSAIGATEGIVYWVETPHANVAVRAKKVGGTTTFSTTTDANGFYRFESLTPGIYNVSCSIAGNLKSKQVKIVTGSDFTGCDFWVPNLTNLPFDETPPIAAKLTVDSSSRTSVTVSHWGYDTETSIDAMSLKIGSTSGGSDVVPATAVFADDPTVTFSGLNLSPGTYYVTASYTNGAGQTTTKTTPFTIAGQGVLAGSVALPGYVGTATSFTVEVRNPGTTTIVDSYTINVANGGTFSLATTRVGTYDVTLKGSHWLRKKMSNVAFTSAGASGLAFSLLNGDCNNDNVVGPSDLLMLRSAYGATPSSSNWNVSADLNGDGVVGPSDLLIIRSNYGQAGQ